MFPEGQLPIQVVRPRGGRPAAAAVVAVGPERVGGDGDVGVHGAGARLVQNQVHVVVVETAFVLIGGQIYEARERLHQGMKLKQHDLYPSS